MVLTFLWPGKTKHPALRSFQDEYAERIRRFVDCRLVETRTAKGLTERNGGRIMDIEAQGLERNLDGGHVVCLHDSGRLMSTGEFTTFLRTRLESPGRPPVFVAGGFLGLADRILARADERLSLSRMTLSHELARVVLLEQVYRSLSIWKGRPYAK